MKRHTILKFAATAITMLFGAQAHALYVIEPSDGSPNYNGSENPMDCNYSTGPGGINGNTEIINCLDTELGDAFGGLDDLLYKYNTGTGGEDGTQLLAGSYTTLCGPGPDDFNTCTITYDGGTVADAGYIFIKDGNNADFWYLIDISDWDGMETMELRCFWGSLDGSTCTGTGGSISNFQLFGGTTDMPEPGTLALLGLGLFGMGLMRRRQTS